MIINRLKNLDHEEIFAASSLSAFFTDADGGVVLCASGADGDDAIEGDERVHSRHIKNGRINWIDDNTELNAAREELSRQREVLGSEGTIAKAEQRLEEDRRSIEADSALCAGIEELIASKKDIIRRLLNEDAEDEKQKVAMIAFIGAYIRHRSKFEVRTRDMISISKEEFFEAINESLYFLGQAGVKSSMTVTEKNAGTGRIRLETAGSCYDWLENTIESGFDKLLVFNLNVEYDSGRINLLVDSEQKNSMGGKNRWGRFTRSFGKAGA